MPTHHTPLHRAAAEAVAAHAGISATDLKVEAPPRAELGDLAVGCFTIAKARKQNPAEVARAIAAAFTPNKLLASATANGPFVNFRVDRNAVYRWLIDSALRSRLVPSELGTGKTICIDYGSPNISKHLAYHHVRGTTIGHALAQTFRALGYRVVGINFLGDWGTTHGMLLAAWTRWGEAEVGEGAAKPLDISALNALYVRFRAAMAEDPSLEQEARVWFKRLEDGDPEARRLWQRFRDVSWAEFQAVYDILGIEYDEVRGESAYEPDMPRIFDALAAKGLSTESQGALVVELPGEDNPILLRTRDGTTLYATRDVAAAEYRWSSYHFTRSLYVVDRGQALHFRQLFKLLAKMGHEWSARCEHIPYGLVKIDNQRAATRLGNVVLMRDVFTIAENMVRTVIDERTRVAGGGDPDGTAGGAGVLPRGIDERTRVAGGGDPDGTAGGAGVLPRGIDERTRVAGGGDPDGTAGGAGVLPRGIDKNPALAPEQVSDVARQVGVGAIVFANLAPQRDKDIDFNIDNAVSLEGDSGPYLQYSHARCAAIGRKAGEQITSIDGIDVSRLTNEFEWKIARRLIEFPDSVVRASEACEPHVICHYLLQLAGDFSQWYTVGGKDAENRVLTDDADTRRARLALVAAVQATLRDGLAMLGIAAPDQM